MWLTHGRTCVKRGRMAVSLLALPPSFLPPRAIVSILIRKTKGVVIYTIAIRRGGSNYNHLYKWHFRGFWKLQPDASKNGSHL